MFKQRGHMIGVLSATLAVIAFMLPLRPPCYCQPKAPSPSPESAPSVEFSCCHHHAEPAPSPADGDADEEGCTGCCTHAQGCANCDQPCCLGKPTMGWPGAFLYGPIVLTTNGAAAPEELTVPASRSLEDVFHPPKA